VIFISLPYQLNFINFTNHKILKTKILFLIFLSAFLITIPVSAEKDRKKQLVTGIVNDNKGMPVKGALIYVDNVNTWKTTDKNGIYKIRIKPDACMISATAEDFGSGKNEIKGKQKVDITLDGMIARKSENDDEKINVGYGEVDQKNLTQPVSRLNKKSINSDSYTSIYEMIKGQIPGVDVSGSSIRIQGANSFMGSTEPLLVVDGMTVQSIEDISPREVKSIEVLKGSSAAIYGSRGANGVILITLKGAKNLQ